MFQNISRNTQGGTAHHIFNGLSRQLGLAEEPFSEYEKNYEKPVHFGHRNVRNGDNTNLWTTLDDYQKQCAGALHPPPSASNHK